MGTQDEHLSAVAAGKASWLAFGAVFPSNVPGRVRFRARKEEFCFFFAFFYFFTAEALPPSCGVDLEGSEDCLIFILVIFLYCHRNSFTKKKKENASNASDARSNVINVYILRLSGHGLEHIVLHIFEPGYSCLY